MRTVVGGLDVSNLAKDDLFTNCMVFMGMRCIEHFIKRQGGPSIIVADRWLPARSVGSNSSHLPKELVSLNQTLSL